MCGIAGAVNFRDAEKTVKAALAKIAYRGKDGSGFYSEKNVCFGHLLHSVVGSAKQPIVKEGFVLGANCEIYNWKELVEKHGFNSKNDAELLLDLLIYHLKNKKPGELLINEVLDELDGVFAFFLYSGQGRYLLLARDKIGVKPVWFSCDGKRFVFASEKKAIEEFSPEELNPRKVVLFDKRLNLLNQKFFEISEKEIDIEKAKSSIKNLLLEAAEKRIPEKKLGLLFSAGIDSTLLAFILKKKGVDFVCYTTICEGKEEIEKTAKKLDLKLKIVNVTKGEVKRELPKIIKLIETADPVKVEVALTMYFSLKEAKRDKIKVIFSGLGADDIFAGYKRMLMSESVNHDSLSNLRRLYERDLYRDDILSMANNIELRLPYLDKELVKNVLRIPSKYKSTETPKQLLRKVAEEVGLSKELTELKRKAAQYDSGIHKIVAQIAKEKGEMFRGSLFSKIYKPKLKLAILLSTGKDSTYAMHIQKRINYEIACLITMESANKDSFMFHTPAIRLAKQQSEALQIPLIMEKTTGAKEKELEKLKKVIKKAKDKYRIQGIVTGALFSNYQRSRIEKICDELNLKVYSPLWHMDQEAEMRSLIKQGYEFVFTKIAAEGLNKDWLGRSITMQDVDELVRLNKKFGINITGEGGEFETLVLDCPLFKKRIEIEKYAIIEEKDGSAAMIIKKARLVKKKS
jgi:asparagine synthase (glutamine-hydrolysing)